MPTLNDVYRKFGEASEAAQLLETELGNILFANGAIDAGLLDASNPARAADLLQFVNRQTLGQLVKSLSRTGDALEHLESALSAALTARNRLAHTFYREHNFRRNSDQGCSVMLADLEAIHTALIDAYKAVMLLSGIDLDKVQIELPTRHLPI